MFPLKVRRHYDWFPQTLRRTLRDMCKPNISHLKSTHEGVRRKTLKFTITIVHEWKLHLDWKLRGISPGRFCFPPECNNGFESSPCPAVSSKNIPLVWTTLCQPPNKWLEMHHNRRSDPAKNKLICLVKSFDERTFQVLPYRLYCRLKTLARIPRRWEWWKRSRPRANLELKISRWQKPSQGTFQLYSNWRKRQVMKTVFLLFNSFSQFPSDFPENAREHRGIGWSRLPCFDGEALAEGNLIMICHKHLCLDVR